MKKLPIKNPIKDLEKLKLAEKKLKILASTIKDKYMFETMGCGKKIGVSPLYNGVFCNDYCDEYELCKSCLSNPMTKAIKEIGDFEI